MRIRKPSDIPGSDITPENVFLNRRRFMQQSAVLGAGLGLSTQSNAGLQADDGITPEVIATNYNNFYEFGTDKSDPVQYAHNLTIDPWTVTVSGEANKTGKFAFEDIVKGLTPEERIYRFRCVEAWSMVVPWQGIELKSILQQFEPTSNAKYVEFKTLVRPSEMRGQGGYLSSIDWALC